MYPRDPVTNREIYPFNPFENKFVYEKNQQNVQVLARDENNLPYYASFENGQEYYPKVDGKEEYTNQIKYIVGPDQRERYPYSVEKNSQIYDLKLKYAKDLSNGDEMYAINEKRDQYPFDRYARDRNGMEMYPRYVFGDVYYAKNEKDDDVLAKAADGSEYYVVNQNVLKFPKTKDGEEFYAKNADGTETYGFSNEYPYQNQLKI